MAESSAEPSAQPSSDVWIPSDPDVMEIVGSLDDHTSPEIEEDAGLCIKSGARRMVLDCKGMDHLTAAGLRSILKLAREMHNSGGRIAVSGLSPEAHAMFEACGVPDFIPCYGDVNEAMASLTYQAG